jgi:hypothetical protein
VRHDRTAIVHRRPIGSLAHDEIALLLGLPALLRGATPAAFDTLHADVVADAARWRDELAPQRLHVRAAVTPGWQKMLRTSIVRAMVFVGCDPVTPGWQKMLPLCQVVVASR